MDVAIAFNRFGAKAPKAKVKVRVGVEGVQIVGRTTVVHRSRVQCPIHFGGGGRVHGF